MEPEILIYGYGGHGRVLAELLFEAGFKSVGVFDDSEIGEHPEYVTYLGTYDAKKYSNVKILIGVGNNLIREKISCKIVHPFYTFIHTSAYISANAQLGVGTVVLQNVVIQTNAQIGSHTIINIGAKIDHDTQIGDFAHIAPQSYVGGGSIISSFIDLNPGQIIPRISKL